MEISLLEWFGYISSVVVAVSLMMSNIKMLRWINLFGAAMFSVYGLLIDAYPVFVLNGFIALADIYYLFIMRLQKDFFSTNDTLTKDAFFTNHFLDYFKEDIAKFFPIFNLDSIENPRFILVSRNMNPVGLFIYEEQDNGVIQIHLDYVRSEFRDCKNAAYLYNGENAHLRDKGFHTMKMISSSVKHEKFLQKQGFQLVDVDKHLYERTL
jgi:hypothetical protein